MKNRRGMTLIEILAAMGVLIVGMTAIASMLVTSSRFGRRAIDRNTVAAIVSEAVADIERRHLITSALTLTAGPAVPAPAEDVGLFIETVNSLNATPSIHSTSPNFQYGEVTLSGGSYRLASTLDAKFLDSPDKTKIHYAVWPLPAEDPKYVGGMPRSKPGLNIEATSGTPVRILYKLERHPDWHAHSLETSGGNVGEMSYDNDPANLDNATNPHSPYRGVYILTMIVYKQLAPDLSSIEQISDPFVVYLRDKKVRN